VESVEPASSLGGGEGGRQPPLAGKPAEPLTPAPADAGRAPPVSDSALVIDAAEPEVERRRDVSATRKFQRRPPSRRFVEAMPPTVQETEPVTPSEVSLEAIDGHTPPVLEKVKKQLISARLER